MKHNYKRITALAGMTALLVSMPVSVYAGQIRNTYTANLSNVLGSVDVSALKEIQLLREVILWSILIQMTGTILHQEQQMLCWC